MRKPFPAIVLAASTLAPAALLFVPSPAAAQMPVFDATNYAQNILQAARALEQINHQVTSLQNEATMLQNMAKNLQRIDFPELAKLNGTMQQIGQLMGEAQGIGFKVGDIDQRFRTLFPGSAGTALKNDQRVADAEARLQSAMDSFRHSMTVQSQVVANIGEDSKLLGQLVDRSQSAEGALQVSQASNQLLALSAKQQLQLQDLLAAEFRSQALDRARQAQSEAEARSATTRFLGSGKAYSSTHE